MSNTLFICALCAGKLTCPTEIGDCGHIFCMECVKIWQQSGNNNCPLKCGALLRFENIRQIDFGDLHKRENIPFRCENH